MARKTQKTKSPWQLADLKVDPHKANTVKGGGKIAQPTVSEITITKTVDSSTPKLM
jgi:type VI protein secretion system component Hcp